MLDNVAKIKARNYLQLKVFWVPKLRCSKAGRGYARQQVAMEEAIYT